MNNETSFNATRDLPNSIGSNIRKKRIDQNISLNQLARLCRITPSYLSLIERNQRRRVSYPILHNIAEVLQISADELMRVE